MSLTKVSYSMIDHAPVNVMDFGAVGDGVADDTAALQAALDAVFANNGGTLRIPAGNYKITADLVPQISGTTSRFFRIIGDGMESTNIVGAGYGLKIYGDTPPARTNAFVSVWLEGFSMVGSGLTGIGIDIYSMQRSQLSNVSARGYDYGLRLRSSWTNSITDRCCFEENNVGIKVPQLDTTTIEANEGVNTTDISGISCRENVKAGISIGYANVLTIQDVLLESNPVGVYLLERIQWAKIRSCYYEAGSITLTRTRRDGTLSPFGIYCGSDEDFTVGGSPGIDTLSIDLMMEYFGEGKIYLDNVTNVNIENPQNGNATFAGMSDRVTFARSKALVSDPRFASILQNVGRSTANGVFKKYPYNLISNGNMALPNLPLIRNTTGNATTARTTQTIDGSSQNVMAVTLPTGETSNVFFFEANLGAEYRPGNRLCAGIRAKGSTSDITSVKLILQDGLANNIGFTNTVSGAGTTSWFNLADTGDTADVSVTNSALVKVEVTRTAASSDDTLYINEVILVPSSYAGEVLSGSSFDLETGLAGTVTPTTLASGWYYAEVNPNIGSGGLGDFRIIATPRFDGTYTAANVQIQYLSGADDGKFRVWCDRTGVVVDYRILLVKHFTP
jgi:hypothetical protein